MRHLSMAAACAAALAVSGCDYLPDYAKALINKPPATSAIIAGTFTGPLKVVFLEPKKPDDRNIQTLEVFGYKDSKGVEWTVPAGTVSDGASIPWSLWSFIGGPFDGPYRDAAVIHDYFCHQKTRTWEEVHTMFLEASIRRGTPESLAQTMYAGILYGGPRWDAPKTTVKAQIIPIQSTTPQKADPGITNRGATNNEKAQFDELKKWIEETKPTPDQIKKRVEDMRKANGLAK